MISKAVRDKFDWATKEEFEEFLVKLYPLGELVERENTLVFNTGVPNATGNEDVVIDTGMYLNQIGLVRKYEARMVVK